MGNGCQKVLVVKPKVTVCPAECPSDRLATMKHGKKLSLEKTSSIGEADDLWLAKRRQSRLISLDAMKPDLTLGECRMIATTWSAINVDHIAKGMKVLDLMMQSAEIKALFPFRNQPPERLHKLPLYRQHAGRIVQSVGAIVDEITYLMNESSSDADENNQKQLELQRGPMKMAMLLYSLGQAHGRIHGLTPDFFNRTCDDYIIRSLLQVWKDEIGLHWTPAVENAWTKLFNFITAQIYRGILFDAKLPRTSSASSALAEMEAHLASYGIIDLKQQQHQQQLDQEQEAEKVPWYYAINAFMIGSKKSKQRQQQKLKQQQQQLSHRWFPFSYGNNQNSELLPATHLDTDD